MGELTQRLRTSGDWRFCDSRHRDELAAADLLESQAAELATLRKQNAEQAKKLEERKHYKAYYYGWTKQPFDCETADDADWCKRGKNARDQMELLERDRAEQAKRIGELEDEVPHPGDGSCDRCGAVPSVDIPTALCPTCLEALTENTTLRSELAELRETVEVAKKHLETAFAEDVDLAEGTANIRLALQALAALTADAREEKRGG